MLNALNNQNLNQSHRLKTVVLTKDIESNDKLLAETVLDEVVNNCLRLVEATMVYHHIKLVFTTAWVLKSATLLSNKP